MILEDNYYKILRSEVSTNEMTGTFDVELLPGCEVYQGHFPGNPVCPGVCNIATIRECAERLTGQPRLYVSSINKCRLTALATPSACPRLRIDVTATPAENGYNVTARISDDTTNYMEYKGEMTV